MIKEWKITIKYIFDKLAEEDNIWMPRVQPDPLTNMYDVFASRRERLLVEFASAQGGLDATVAALPTNQY